MVAPMWFCKNSLKIISNDFSVIFRLSLRDNLIKWVRCPSVHPSVNISQKRLLQITGPIHTKFGVRHQGNEPLSGCAPHLDPPPSGGNGRQLTPKFGVFFKSLLVKNYYAECTEIDTEASRACLDGNLCSALPLAHSEGGSSASPYFRKSHQNVFSSRTIRPIQIKFSMRH